MYFRIAVQSEVHDIRMPLISYVDLVKGFNGAWGRSVEVIGGGGSTHA